MTSSAISTTTDSIIEGFDSLDKWKNCRLPSADEERAKATKIPQRLVYQHNRSRAASKGFPSVLEVGRSKGLTDRQVTALFGWTTGDYRLVNPIARGEPTAEFSDYPFLPHDLTKVHFSLTREQILPYVSILSEALSKLPAEDSSGAQRFWRGHRRGVQGRFLLKGFTSVTRDRENALDFCAKTDDNENSKERTLIAIVNSKSGRCISKFSARPEEMEVLFQIDTEFEVVDPPADSREDLEAIKPALAKLRSKIPGAEIDLVYVKEVEATEWE